MDIQIGSHTLERAAERGATEGEIRDVLQKGVPIPGKQDRLGKARVYDFRQARLGKYYEQKRVEVFYTSEGQTLITVTVYVFYGKWEGESANPV